MKFNKNIKNRKDIKYIINFLNIFAKFKKIPQLRNFFRS